MKVVDRVEAGYGRRIAAARRRSAAFDHFCRAWERYAEVLAGRLAAAIAYYGFFAVFALGLVAYAVFGLVLRRNSELRNVANEFLIENLPFIKPGQILESSGTLGVVGLIGLALTGIAWVEAIRSSQRLIYRLNQQPGNFLVRRVVDLGVLVGVFMLIGLSVAAVDTLESLLRWLLGNSWSVPLAMLSWLLTVVVNMVLATALLVAVPRLRMPARQLAPPVLLVSIGITLLNSIGRKYVLRTEQNPAYTVVATAVGLLLYLYLLNQLLLFGAAFAATDERGWVLDLADSEPAKESGTETGPVSGPPAARDP